MVTWAPEDRQADPAFLCEAPFRFRRAGDQWKLPETPLEIADRLDGPRRSRT